MRRLTELFSRDVREESKGPIGLEALRAASARQRGESVSSALKDAGISAADIQPVKIASQDQGPELFVPTSNPAPGLYEIVSGGKPLPSYAALRAMYAEPGDAPETDFRAALKDDTHAWETRSRLEIVLGRPFLATELVDQLTPHTSARLAARLESLITDAITDAVAKVHHDVEVAVALKINAIHEEQIKHAREVSRERFGDVTRNG